MDYLLLLLTALVAFAYGMLFALWLIFARTASRLAHLLEDYTGRCLSLEEVYQTLKTILDKAYEELEKENHENSQAGD
ncbi:MAG TPA: hypothetical protein ENN54_04250 [Thermoplasmatales archaeon]|nr:hypothetical protein [Candidatus Thermoplasmatota archaeon]HDS59486.1 hypothetical protein [Thermoplasmatales archaeon]